MACYLATPVTNSNNTNEVPSQDKNNQTSSTVNDLKTPYEDLPWASIQVYKHWERTF